MRKTLAEAGDKKLPKRPSINDVCIKVNSLAIKLTWSKRLLGLKVSCGRFTMNGNSAAHGQFPVMVKRPHGISQNPMRPWEGESKNLKLCGHHLWIAPHATDCSSSDGPRSHSGGWMTPTGRPSYKRLISISAPRETVCTISAFPPSFISGRGSTSSMRAIMLAHNQGSQILLHLGFVVERSQCKISVNKSKCKRT